MQKYPKKNFDEKNSISNALSHISIESHALVEKEVNSKASYCIIVKSWMAFHLHLSIHFHYIHPSSASLLTQWISHSHTHILHHVKDLNEAVGNFRTSIIFQSPAIYIILFRLDILKMYQNLISIAACSERSFSMHKYKFV